MATADFTIADVLAWARTKPADEHYRYNDNTNCALCQFLRETGRARAPSAGSVTWADWESGIPYRGRWIDHPIPQEIGRAVCRVRTFGDLVEQLEKLCPETPVTPSNWAAIDAYLTDIEQVEA
jgi:hypothetical protein